jgi:hypothetical protein
MISGSYWRRWRPSPGRKPRKETDRANAVTAAANRHLIFGMLALQSGLVDQGPLAAAFQAWTRDKARSLAGPLVARGDLDAGACAGLEPPLSYPSS